MTNERSAPDGHGGFVREPDLAGSSREVQLSVRGLSKAFHGRPAIEDIDSPPPGMNLSP
jgi:hypothetical protein